MSIHFRGGELQQKGKGIGGFFRAIGSVLKPFLLSIGRTAVTAAKSKTGKAIRKAISEQALDSAMNMTKDVLGGNSLKDSYNKEATEIKSKAINAISKVQKRRKQQGQGAKIKRQKRVKTKIDEMKHFFR